MHWECPKETRNRKWYSCHWIRFYGRDGNFCSKTGVEPTTSTNWKVHLEQCMNNSGKMVKPLWNNNLQKKQATKMLSRQ